MSRTDEPMGSEEMDLKPPREVLDEMPYQAVEPIPEDEYQRMARDIKDRGVIQPIVTDEHGNILDGHHRKAIVEQLDLDETKQPAEVIIGDLQKDREKLARAIKMNLMGRDIDGGVKSSAVEQYIEHTWPRDDESGAIGQIETQQEVADKLGVSRRLVGEVVNNGNVAIIDHDRLKARRYYENNPDASYREVARQVDSAKATVTKWLKEDFEEGDEDDQTKDINLVARTRDPAGDEADKARDVIQKAREGDETAEEQAEKVARGGSPDTAHKEVEKAEAEAAVEEQRTPDTTHSPTVVQSDACGFLDNIDSAELLVADPPYSTDVDDIQSFASSWLPGALDTVQPEHPAFVFIGAYPEELQAYLSTLESYGARQRTQVLVWTYRNTLGQTPNDEYKLNWQAILFIQSDPPTDLDAPKTSEQWAVQDVNAPDARFGDRFHQWQKPTELIERFIRHTTSEGDHVIDPFVGTGTTVLTATELGRRATGADNDPEMLDIAEERGCVIDGV